jgi:hypothetical protein
MTILFAGGEIGSCLPLTGGCYEVEETQSGATPFRTENARCAVRLGNSADMMDSPTHTGAAAVGYCWNAYYFNTVIGTDQIIWEAYAGSTPQIRLYGSHAGSTTVALQYWDGSTWQTSGEHEVANSVLQRLEVFVNKTSGVLQLYVSGTLVINETESLSHLSNFTKCRWYGARASTAYFSEWSAATTANAVAAVKTHYATGNGAQTAWTGDYTAIDELVYSDADGISSSVGDEVETFTHGGPDLEAYVILAVCLGIRGKAGSSGPTGQQGVLRIGGSNYTSSTDTLGAGYGAFCPVWETNPATSGAWAGSAAEGLEFGVKSIT